MGIRNTTRAQNAGAEETKEARKFSMPGSMVSYLAVKCGSGVRRRHLGSCSYSRGKLGRNVGAD